ncbi:hypothetical protein A2U01_0072302, partial [Trifolium medium]|nr:hypothetical protein [Trifolium medium]
SRALRSRTTIPVKTAGEDTSTQEGVSDALKDTAVKDVAENVVKGTEAIKDAVPSPATVVANDGDKPSVWENPFDPIAFVERNLIMKGDSS